MYYPELQTVADTVAFHAVERPEQVAIVCEGRTVNYGELHAESNRTARALRAAGFGRGARVGYLGKESEHYYEIFFACAKSETVLVPINWRLTASEVDHILRDSGTEILFVEHELLATALEAQKTLPRLRLVVDLDGTGPLGSGLGAWKAGQSDEDVVPATGGDDPIVQLYTSGTTGLPKGVVLAQRSFFKIRDGLAEQGLDWLDWQPGDVSLIGIPGFHVAGIWWAMQGFSAGVPNVSLRVFRSKDALGAIREHRRHHHTRGAGDAAHVARRTPPRARRLREPAQDRLRWFADLREPAAAMPGGVRLPSSRSSTASPRAATPRSACRRRITSSAARCCAPPAARCRACEIKVVDSNGVNVPPGTVGEICMQTPAVMLEYWGLPQATADTLADGWLHTGDAGTLDADGYVFISDRIKDTIIVAGENVYPAEVENALCKHPAVAEAAVIGVPDERWGEAIRAFVALRAGFEATPRQLMLFLKGTIADFKIPTRYDFVPSVPRNPSGKILRRVLRDQCWAHMERKVN